jgi:spore maturation protein CgeB
MTRLAFFGSSLLSAYWNGAATYYRGLLQALASLGWDITFYEPDAYDRQSHRDIDPPEWARVVVYPATVDAVRAALAEASGADVMVKASGVGVFDTELLAGLTATRSVRVFWDVDAPATIAEMRAAFSHPLRRSLGGIDLVLTYGGGDPVVEAYTAFGARQCVPIYNALNPAMHFPVAPDPGLAADLGFLANRMPDREARAGAFFFAPAAALPDKRFLLAGAGWDDKPASANIRRLGHVGTSRHNAFNCSCRAVLNVSRDSMASTGFSPATRVFEAAGAGACLITDAWEGIELFLKPDTEVLVARDGQDVADHLSELTPDRGCVIGAAARARILMEHTYAQRARIVDRLLHEALARAGEPRAA